MLILLYLEIAKRERLITIIVFKKMSVSKMNPKTDIIGSIDHIFLFFFFYEK